MASASLPLTWCESCEIEFPMSRPACPVCGDSHRSEPRPEGLVGSLFRRRFDKAVPKFRIHRNAEGVWRASRKSMLFGVACVAFGNLIFVFKMQDDRAASWGSIVAIALFVDLLAVLGFLLWYWKEKSGPPIDVLDNDILRYPDTEALPRSLIIASLMFIAQRLANSMWRNASWLTAGQWTTARISRSDDGERWILAWQGDCVVLPFDADYFPNFDQKLSALQSTVLDDARNSPPVEESPRPWY